MLKAPRNYRKSTFPSQGKVLFLEEVSPWVVILDVDWFVDIIRVLETSKPEKTTAGHVPSLHPATRAWEDKQLAVLAKDKTLNEKKVSGKQPEKIYSINYGKPNG